MIYAVNISSTQLADVEHLLRLYTHDGSAPLPRADFAAFVVKNIPIGDLPKRFSQREPFQKIKRVKPTNKDGERHLASAALLVSYALYPFTAKKNHWAEFEAWIIFSAHAVAVAERLDLPDAVWLPTYELSFLAARTALEALVQEATSRDQWLEGDVMVDSHVYRARITIVLGLMALHTIICRLKNEPDGLEQKIAEFVDKHRMELHLWGETAVPYMALLAFYLERRLGAPVGENLLGSVVSGLAHQNRPQKEKDLIQDASLSDPYLEISDAIARSIGIRREPEWDRRSYDGQAYSLRALVMLLAKRLRRQLLASNWYEITEVNFVEMYPTATWEMLLWRATDGDLTIRSPRRPQSWAALLQEAQTIDANSIPKRLRLRPDFLAAFLTVFPHRLRADTLNVVAEAI